MLIILDFPLSCFLEYFFFWVVRAQASSGFPGGDALPKDIWRGWLNPHDLHAAKWQPHKAPPWPSARGQGEKTVCSLAYIRVFVYVVGGIAAVAAVVAVVAVGER